MKSFALSSALLFVLAASASADVTPSNTTTPVPAVISPSEAAAKAELQKMADALESSVGITYTAKISVTVAQPKAASTIKEYDSTVTAEKAGPAFLSVSATTPSHEDIYADGKNITVYDSASSKYSTSPGASGLTTGLRDLVQDLRSLGLGRDAMTVVEMGASFPMAYMSNQFFATKVPASWKVLTSIAPGTVDGKDVDVITVTYIAPQVSIVQSYSVDKTSYLPLAIDESAKLPNGTAPSEVHTEFSNLQLLNAPSAPSTFTFAPPTGSTLVATVAPPPTPVLLAGGKAAPNFTVQSVSGKPVKLSNYTGKVVVVDFWATWCGPCQESLPHTDAIAKKYKTKGVVFLPICSWDEHTAFLKWQKAHQSFAMPFYFDPAGSDGAKSVATKLYQVSGIPTQYVIGKDGKIVTSFVGYDEQGDPTESALVKALDKALAGS